MTAEAQDTFQEFVSLLITLEKNIVLYPPEHDSIKKATEALNKNVQVLLDKHHSLVLLTSQDKLIINGYQLPPGNTRSGKLALFFSQRGIISVTLEQGMTVRELVRFLEILHELPPKSDILQYPSLKEALNTLSHISMKQFELKSLRVQNQEQVETPGDDRAIENRWDKILRSSIGGTENKEIYRSLFALFPDLEPAGEAHTQAASPDIPVDFDDASLLEELQNNMPEEMVLAISMHALHDNRQISPALQKLLVTLSSIQKAAPDEMTPQKSAIGADAIQKLFEKERYDEYVSTDYSQQLNALLRNAGPGDTAAETAARPAEIRETDLEDIYVNRWLVQSLLGLMNEPYNGEIIKGCGEQLALMIPEFLARKDFTFLCSVYLALTKLETQNSGAAASCAEALRLGYADFTFTESLKNHFLISSAALPEKLEDLIFFSGPNNISWLLDVYAKGEDERQRIRALRLLLKFRSDTASVILNRIAALDHSLARPLLRLITICGGDPADSRLLPLLDAPEQEVRMEVARMCLSAGSAAPIPLLIRMIGSKDLAEALLAIRIAGEYKVSALIPELTQRIQTGYISETGATRNRAIFESLNKIGDTSALPNLLKTAAMRLSPTPGRLRATQEALFSNLSGYPADALKALVEIGLKSSDPRIRHSAKKFS